MRMNIKWLDLCVTAENLTSRSWYFTLFCVFMFILMYTIYCRYEYPNNTCHPLYDCVCPDFGLSTGGLCGPGYYCPQGSEQPLTCPGGMYCETPGLAVPTGMFVCLLCPDFGPSTVSCLFFSCLNDFVNGRINHLSNIYAKVVFAQRYSWATGSWKFAACTENLMYFTPRFVKFQHDFSIALIYKLINGT